MERHSSVGKHFGSKDDRLPYSGYEIKNERVKKISSIWGHSNLVNGRSLECSWVQDLLYMRSHSEWRCPGVMELR